MPDFAALRRAMVDGQVRTADVTDQRIIEAMLELPRERFVADDKAAVAYLDLDVPVGDAKQATRRLLKPMVLAKLVQIAAPAATDRVLDVGCGTGYSTALLAHLAATVVGLEEDAALARRAAETIVGLGLHNARIVTSPLTRGVSESAPYNVIILEGSCEVIPTGLLDQLDEGGRLITIVGRNPGKAVIYRRTEGEFSSRPVFDAAAAPLPGFAKPLEFVF